jgi:hypothetical protein
MPQPQHAQPNTDNGQNKATTPRTRMNNQSEGASHTRCAHVAVSPRPSEVARTDTPVTRVAYQNTCQLGLKNEINTTRT